MATKKQKFDFDTWAKTPQKLPQGLAEFESWSKAIIDGYEMPDNDSIRFALATNIMHLSTDPRDKAMPAAYVAPEYFGHTLIKGAANQVAHAVMQDLKAKQAAEIEAAKTAEATAVTPESVTPDAPQEA